MEVVNVQHRNLYLIIEVVIGTCRTCMYSQFCQQQRLIYTLSKNSWKLSWSNKIRRRPTSTYEKCIKYRPIVSDFGAFWPFLTVIAAIFWIVRTIHLTLCTVTAASYLVDRYQQPKMALGNFSHNLINSVNAKSHPQWRVYMVPIWVRLFIAKEIKVSPRRACYLPPETARVPKHL